MSEQRRWIRGGIGVVAAGLALWLGLEYEEPSPALPGRTALPPIEKVEAEPARPSVTGQSLVVASGQTLQLEAARIPAGSPLVLELVVPVEAYADATLPVRILSEGREPLRLEASMSRNEGVRLEIPSDQLTPGRYLIEMKTPERSPLPLRRYVLEIN